MAGFLPAFFFVFFAIFFGLRERFVDAGRERIAVIRSLALTLKNRAFRILTGLYLCSFLALDILTAAAKYYLDDYIGRPRLMPVMMGSMLGCALLSLPLYRFLTARF